MSKKGERTKPTVMDHISQIAILGGAIGMMFITSGHWIGFVLSLVTQPFWFYTSWRNRQWGVFTGSVIYTIAFLVGLSRALHK
ncbi:MAG TPA: hypothetical protein VGE59_04830 [Patescibacteria group bacterium]